MLENKNIGFLGAGMMAEAIARGLLKAGIDRERINASDPDDRRRDLFERELGIETTVDNAALVGYADIVILAVKPFVVAKAIADCAPPLAPPCQGGDGGVGAVKPGHLVISIAAGVKTETIESRLGGEIPVVRVMPNTPCLIGEGASAIAPGKHAGAAELAVARSIFEAVGKVVEVTEDKMDAVTGLSGSGPAYVYMLIEALADGGVRVGLPKATALLLAAQTVAGAAGMVLETGEHPAVLRDRVMTPGGTTIAGVTMLERAGFRSAAMEAVIAATERSAELGKQ